MFCVVDGLQPVDLAVYFNQVWGLFSRAGTFCG